MNQETKGLKRENISIVLVKPQIPENIGAAARAMNNMGIGSLILVEPKNPDTARILKSATSHSSTIIDAMEIYDNLGDAIGKYQYIAGTTARLGSCRPAIITPGELAETLVSVTQKNRAAIMFGPEDRGLSNEHLRYCHTITSIPTADMASLNLAQAVMIICYEIFMAGSKRSDLNAPRMANSFELEGMYEHLKDVLLKIGFLNPQNPEHWMLHIRRFLSRVSLRAREARIIRGICRQIDWYAGQHRKQNDKGE